MPRNRISEKTYHSLYLAGIFAKALIALGEIVSGFIFAFFSYDALYRVAFWFFGSELSESPRDVVWVLIVRAFGGFTATPRAVWVFIFLSHGIVKLLLIAGLWRDKKWAYPASIVIFTLFIFYQLYQIALTPSVVLWAITLVDVAVVLLIAREYRHRDHILLEL
jgi:uncharacterized membrane protein